MIGRASGCDLALYDDTGVADRHAEVVQSGGKYILRPVGGTAVLVNDRIVREHTLQNEDVFQVGSQMLIGEGAGWREESRTCPGRLRPVTKNPNKLGTPQTTPHRS